MEVSVVEFTCIPAVIPANRRNTSVKTNLQSHLIAGTREILRGSIRINNIDKINNRLSTTVVIKSPASVSLLPPAVPECLDVHFHVYLFVYLYTCLFICLGVYLFGLRVCLFDHSSLLVPNSLESLFGLFICCFFYLFVYLFVCLLVS